MTGTTKHRKHPSLTKPRSDLQILQSQTNWALNFKLQYFHEGGISSLDMNYKLRAALDEYDKATLDLKYAIKLAAKLTKQRILSERKKLIDSFENPDIV